jgi:hypothetical protein
MFPPKDTYIVHNVVIPVNKVSFIHSTFKSNHHMIPNFKNSTNLSSLRFLSVLVRAVTQYIQKSLQNQVFLDIQKCDSNAKGRMNIVGKNVVTQVTHKIYICHSFRVVKKFSTQ